MATQDGLQNILGFKCQNPALLEQALTHSSYANEHMDTSPGSNERLEYLGDAVLGLVIADKLYRNFPGLSEGQLTRRRASLVRQDTLARIARNIGLGDYLYLGKGEEASGGRNKPANLARAIEAVIAAVFLDSGLAAARKMILKLYKNELAKTGNGYPDTDYKSRLQEVLQSRRKLVPVYRQVSATGPDHEKRFTVEVIAGEEVLGRGSGKSKKSAEAQAARMALESLTDHFTQ